MGLLPALGCVCPVVLGEVEGSISKGEQDVLVPLQSTV